MPPENEGAPAVAEAHPSDSVHVDIVEATPLVVAKEQPEETGNAAAPAHDAAATAEAPAGDATGKPGKPPKLPEWAQKQFNDLAAEKRIADRETKRLADELAAMKAPKPEPAAATPTAADTAAATAAAPAGGFKTQADFEAAVATEANKRAQEARQQDARQQFDAKSNDTYTKGKTAFGDDFDTAANNLRSVGAMNPDILEMVFATEDPAKVLFDLGSDPDKAASIVGMSPAARAIEIAKLSVAAPQRATPAAVSNAPRPITPIDGSARVSSAPSDNDDDETFFRKREAELAAKRAAG